MATKMKDVVTLANTLLGTYIKAKEIHFNTTNRAEHKLTDNVSTTIIGWVDSIMEDIMGTEDARPGMGILIPTKCKCSSTADLLKMVKQSLVDMKKQCTDPKYAGLNKMCDDFIESVNKWIYLSRNK